MLPDDLKDFKARDEEPLWFLAPDIITALIFAALTVLLIVERL
jgi:hypothetical protein